MKQVLTLENDVNHSATGLAKAVQGSSFWLATEMRIVWAVLFLYAISFLSFYPAALTNADEVAYVRQAVTFAGHSTTVDTIDPLTGAHHMVHPSDYPPGTSALLAPFVWIAGWRGSFLLGLFALIACVVFTAKWIAESGASPLFSLIILGYPPTLVMARTAMSDVPSACLASAALWLFWQDKQGSGWRRLLAGAIAALSLSFREPNAILFTFFFLGACLRRERHLLALIAGGIAGITCRLLAASIVYGNPFFAKHHIYHFNGMYATQNLLIYLTALLVFVPGGLLSAFLYRGRRWTELSLTVAAFLFLFVLYDYNAAPSGGLKEWILAPRFLIPLLPLLAFAMAHTVPRWYASFLERRREHKIRWQGLAQATVAVWLAGVSAAACFINWRSQIWSKAHQDVVRAVYSNTDSRVPIATDSPSTIKFLNELYGARMVAELNDNGGRDLPALFARYSEVQIVSFERDDSDYWLWRAKQDRELLKPLSAQYDLSLKFQQRYPGLGVLRIWSVSRRA